MSALAVAFEVPGEAALARRPVGRPSKAEPFREFVARLLATRPELLGTEILGLAKANGYTGGKSALFALVADVRQREGLPSATERWASSAAARARLTAKRQAERDERRAERAAQLERWKDEALARKDARAQERQQRKQALKEAPAASRAHVPAEAPPIPRKYQPRGPRAIVDPAPPGVVTLGTALGWMLKFGTTRCAEATRAMYETHGTYLLDYFGDRPLSDFTRAAGYKLLWAYAEAEHARGVKYTTVSKRLVALRLALKEAIKRDVIAAPPPWPELPADATAREIFLTYEQYLELRTHLGLDCRLMLDLGVWTGMHSSDLLGTTWGMVDLGGGPGCAPAPYRPAAFLRRNSKNSVRPEWVEMPAELRRHLTAERERLGAQPDRNTRLVPRRRDTMHHGIRDTALRLGMSRVSLIDLRRTCATWWIASGGDRDALRVYLGHSPGSVMLEKHYLRVTGSMMAGGVSALNRVSAPADAQSDGEDTTDDDDSKGGL